MDTESQRLLVLHRKRWKDGKQRDGRRLLDQQLRHLSKSDLSRINKKKEQSDLFLTMEKKSKDGISTGKGSDVFPQVSSLSFFMLKNPMFDDSKAEQKSKLSRDFNLLTCLQITNQNTLFINLKEPIISDKQYLISLHHSNRLCQIKRLTCLSFIITPVNHSDFMIMMTEQFNNRIIKGIA